MRHECDFLTQFFARVRKKCLKVFRKFRDPLPVNLTHLWQFFLNSLDVEKILIGKNNDLRYIGLRSIGTNSASARANISARQ